MEVGIETSYVITSTQVMKIERLLEKAEIMLGDTYHIQLTAASLRILCIIYANQKIGKMTPALELERRMNMSGSGISKAVSKLAEQCNLREAGAGLIRKEKDYNPENGRPINTLRLTPKGEHIMSEIFKALE